jgi:hypothetical protein
LERVIREALLPSLPILDKKSSSDFTKNDRFISFGIASNEIKASPLSIQAVQNIKQELLLSIEKKTATT